MATQCNDGALSCMAQLVAIASLSGVVYIGTQSNGFASGQNHYTYAAFALCTTYYVYLLKVSMVRFNSNLSLCYYFCL